MIDIQHELVQSALHIYKEAVQYVVECKRSRAETVLRAHDGSFQEALDSQTVNKDTKIWLENLRNALLVVRGPSRPIFHTDEDITSLPLSDLSGPRTVDCPKCKTACLTGIPAGQMTECWSCDHEFMVPEVQ